MNPFGALGLLARGNAVRASGGPRGSVGSGRAARGGERRRLAAPLRPALTRGRPRRALAGVALAALAVFGYGEVRLAQEFGDGPPLRVAAVQGAIARQLHWDRSTSDANLARYLELNREAAREQATLVFWPEYAVDFYLSEETLERARLFDGVHDAGADVVLGASRYELAGGETRYFNSVYSIDRGGRLYAAVYDKQTARPLRRVRAPRRLPARRLRHVRARRRAAAPLHPQRAGRRVPMRGDPLPRGRARARARGRGTARQSFQRLLARRAPAAAAQLANATFRAIENRRWLVRATPTGVSAIVDAHGRVAARSLGDGPEIVAAELRRSRAVTVYQQVGNAGVAVTCLSVSHSAHANREDRHEATHHPPGLAPATRARREPRSGCQSGHPRPRRRRLGDQRLDHHLRRRQQPGCDVHQLRRLQRGRHLHRPDQRADRGARGCSRSSRTPSRLGIGWTSTTMPGCTNPNPTFGDPGSCETPRERDIHPDARVHAERQEVHLRRDVRAACRAARTAPSATASARSTTGSRPVTRTSRPAGTSSRSKAPSRSARSPTGRSC